MSLRATHPFDDASSFSEGLVVLESSDGARFLVFKSILSIASPVFADMFSLPQPCSASSSAVPMIKLVESSSTLNILLRLIYPVPNPPILGDNDKDGIEEPQTFIQAAESALSAAFKYEVSMVAEYLRTRLLAASETILDDGSYADRLLPLRLYALACRRGIKQEMRAAAQDCLLFQVADSDFPGLESISAKQYYRLLRFHESVAAAAIAALDTKKFHFRGCYRCDWWPAFTRLARDHLRQRPKTSYIRSIGFLAQVQAEAGCCCSCVPQWNMVLNHIESIVDKAIDKYDSIFDS